MNRKILLALVLLCVLGSVVVSSIDELSYTFKSFFYGTSMAILIIIGLVGIYKFLKKDRTEKS